MTIKSSIREQNVMPKRVPIYSKSLESYISDIIRQLNLNSVSIKQFAHDLEPPYPLVDLIELQDTYHAASLSLVIHSSLIKLKNEIGEANKETIGSCIEEYLDIPERLSGKATREQEGTETTTLTDEMIEIAEDVAYAIRNKGFHIPYLFRGENISMKIVACLALIYTGRKLLEKAKETDSNAQ